MDWYRVDPRLEFFVRDHYSISIRDIKDRLYDHIQIGPIGNCSVS